MDSPRSAQGPRSPSARALRQPPWDQGQYGKLLVAAYRLGMESGPAVSQPDATTLTVVKGAAGGKLAETTERCRAAIAAAEASLRHAQAGLAVAQERLRHARDAEMRLRAQRARKIPAA